MNTGYSEATLDDILLDAIGFAKQAGDIHLHYFRKRELEINSKQGNDCDVVTTADRAAEAAVKQAIKARYPHHSILSEESGLDEQEHSEWQWVVDPLDGTTNYSAGLPYFNVSIGVRHQGHTVVGVVYAARLGELFHAVKGSGAYLNGERIVTPSAPKPLSQAVVTTGFPYDKSTNPDNNINNFLAVLPQVRGLRRIGSSALELSYVSAGFIDGYWETSLHEWDVCAGELIASEAGAKVDRYRHDRGVSIIAAQPSLFNQLRELIKP